MTKTAFITGITGQDGSYLAELLLEKGYMVHGLLRRSSSINSARIDHIYQDPHEDNVRLKLHYGDLTDSTGLNKILREIMPDEIYNLGAQSHVRVSFDTPEYTIDSVGMGAVRLLDAIRDTGIETRLYQASSSELFGKVRETPQTELTPFYPRSPYACAKQLAFSMIVNYREAYQIHASNGILFNHESPRRGEIFVTRKITQAIARILRGTQERLFLGDIEPKRDWGYAKDYVEAMWMMLQQDEPDDYVIAMGENHSVSDFLDLAFGYVGLDWEKYVVTKDKQHMRPTEVDELLGDASKAREKLGWEPRTSFDELVKMMVVEDLKKEGLIPRRFVQGKVVEEAPVSPSVVGLAAVQA